MTLMRDKSLISMTLSAITLNEVRITKGWNIQAVWLNERRTGRNQNHTRFISTYEYGLNLIWEYPSYTVIVQIWSVPHVGKKSESGRMKLAV